MSVASFILNGASFGLEVLSPASYVLTPASYILAHASFQNVSWWRAVPSKHSNGGTGAPWYNAQRGHTTYNTLWHAPMEGPRNTLRTAPVHCTLNN